MRRFTLDTDPHPVFTTYSAGNFAEVAPARLSPMAWSLVGVPAERGMRRLVGRLLGEPRWATGSHFVFVGYFACAPFHNLSAFCHLARHIPCVDPELVTRCYFHGADVPATSTAAPSLLHTAATTARILREAARTARRMRGLAERVTDLETSVAAVAPQDSVFGLCQQLPAARLLVDDVWEAHYATTMAVLPILSLQDTVGRSVTAYWNELEAWVNRPAELVWDRVTDSAAGGAPGPGGGGDRQAWATGFLARAFYEVADDHEPWSRYASRAGGVGESAPGSSPIPTDPWDMVPLARLAQVHRVTWLVRAALQQREATKCLAMRVLHALRPILPAVCTARGLRHDSWPYLTVGELADASLPTDVLLRRARQRRDECLAALAQPVPATVDTAAASQAGEAAARDRRGRSEPRGLGVCPGQVEGVVVTLATDGEPCRKDGVPLVLVCERADVDIHHLLSKVDAVVTARGSALSHVAIMLREYGIPSVVGHPIAAVLRDGQRVRVDGTTGEVRIRDSDT